MIIFKSPKQRCKIFSFFIFITSMCGTVIEQKINMAKIPGSCPDRLFISQENV